MKTISIRSRPIIACAISFVLYISNFLVLCNTETNQTLVVEEDRRIRSTTGWVKLRWVSDAVLSISPCAKEVGIFAKQHMFLSYNGFRSYSGTQAIYVQDESSLPEADNKVQSFTFSQNNIVMVIGGNVFVKKINVNSGWLHKSAGIESPVNKLHAASCCHTEQWCIELNKYIVAFDDTKHSNIVYFSKDAGFNFSRLVFARNFFGALQGLNILYNHLAVTSVVRNGKFEKQAETIAVNFAHALSDFIPVPFYTNGTSFTVYPAPGSSSLLIWDGFSLLHSFNGGQTVENVKFVGTESSTGLGEGENIIQIESNQNGQFLILTSAGNLFYGKESLKPLCQLINPWGDALGFNANVTVVLQDTGYLAVLQPLPNPNPGLLLHWQQYHIRELLLRKPYSMLKSCPIEGMNDFFGSKTTSYLDRYEEIEFTTVLISKPWNVVHYQTLSTNPSLIEVNSEVLKTEYISKGVTRTYMRTVVQQKGSHYLDPKRVGLADVLMVPTVGNVIGCDIKAQQTQHFVVGCPPTKSIKVKIDKQMEDCDVYKNYSYVIPNHHYDPQFMERRNDVTWKDKHVIYDYKKYGCPIRTHYAGTYKPTIEVYIGDKKVGELDGDYVMLEMNGVHDHSYSMAVEEAQCLENSQSWFSMLNNQSEERRDPLTAWNVNNYKDCRNTLVSIPHSASPSQPYEVLNSKSDNRIVWGTKSGMFIFQVIMVDSRTTFCDLRTEFAVFVEGGISTTEIPSLLVSSITVGACLVMLYFSFTTLVYQRKIQVTRRWGQQQLEQLDLTQYKNELPRGTLLQPIQKKRL